MKTICSPNLYFVCLRRGEPPIPWRLDTEEQINKHTAYFGGVLRVMEQNLQHSGLTFYLTWDIGQLPSYGRDVVAVVLGDEWARRPRYAHRVGAVFKCYGTQLTLGCRPVARPSYLNTLTLLHYLGTRAAQLPLSLRAYRERMRKAGGGDVFPIPLGYANQTDLPIKPLAERRYDVSFAGSIVHKPRSAWSPKRWLQTPKSLSRQGMVAALQRVQAQRPRWKVGLTVTPGYHAIRTADPEAYSSLMMDTKVALVPRGTSFETFRYFEALRAGCIVVTEALPSRWFYDGSPAIRIEHWDALEATLDELLGDTDRLQHLHEASLAWWRGVCSEEAVGTFISNTLNACLHPRSSRAGSRVFSGPPGSLRFRYISEANLSGEHDHGEGRSW